MKIDIWTPLPPTESGIANYNDTLFGVGLEGFDIAFMTKADDTFRPDALQVYQLGNNPHHEFVFNQARARPGIIEIHDFSLHHLITEVTLARNDKDGYARFLKESAGDTGYLLAMKRLNGHFHPSLEFELPVLEALIDASHHIIVHSKWARERVRMTQTNVPVTLIPHYCLMPDDEGISTLDRDAIRQTYKIRPNEHLILSAGFVTEPKRIPWLIEALKLCYEKGHRNFKLVIAGEAQVPHLLEGAMNFPDKSRVRIMGYQNERVFNQLFLAADIVPVLRWPSVGESSGVASRALGFGKHVIALDYKSFADLPDDLVELVPLTSPQQVIEDMAEKLIEILKTDPGADPKFEARKAYAEAHLSLPVCRQKYINLFRQLV